MHHVHNILCICVCNHIKQYIWSLCPFSCLSSRSWQLILVSHDAIIHRDYCESYKESVSEPRLHLTSEQSGPIGVDKWSSSQTLGEVKVSRVTLLYSFHSIFQPVHLYIWKLFVPVGNPLLIFSDRPSVSLLVTVVQAELILALEDYRSLSFHSRVQEVRKEAPAFSRGIFYSHWNGAAGTSLIIFFFQYTHSFTYWSSTADVFRVWHCRSLTHKIETTPPVCNATVTQITTRYNWVSECTIRWTLKQMDYSGSRPHQVTLLSAKNRKLRFNKIAQQKIGKTLRHSDGKVINNMKAWLMLVSSV